MNGRIRVMIAEDEPSVRDALAALIRSEPDLDLVAAAGDAVQAIDLARRFRPDVVVLDVKMPGGGGPRAARAIRALCPQTRVTALSAYDDRGSVLEMLGAGAVGYLVKGTPAGEIIEAIRSSARGQGALSTEVTADVIKTLAGQLKREEYEAQRQQNEVRQVRRLLDGEGLWMLFQPIIDLRAGSLIGYEALARFDPEQLRPPTAWFERAAALGMLTELELVAARSSFSRLAGMPMHAYLAVNVSPATLASTSFLEDMSTVPGERIVLEVTEHAKVEDYDALNDALRRLRAQGVRLAIDDAGAGFASMQHIVRLAPDFIKLDIGLTRNIDADPVRRALATALISFASEIGAAMIAEGIETEAEFETLRGLGIAFGQGFFLGEPGPLPRPDAVPDPLGDPLASWATIET
jgi:EAL domain-containing protein (putative c-di-GMP-specific phosphodiesterase class I)/AmiR/NasT family two-component response regulator